MKHNLSFILLIMVFFTIVSSSRSQCDSTNNFCRPNYSNDSLYKISYIGHLNNDCYEDTVIISASKKDVDTLRYSNVFLPKYIFWGRCTLPRDSMEYCPCYDTVGVPDSQKVWYTRIDKPSFFEMAGKVSYLMASTDSLVDIMIIISGKTASDTTASDTSHRIVLYGQDSMDTLWHVDIGDIDSVISSPFSALRLEVNKQLVDSAVRDVSYQASYYFVTGGSGMPKRNEDYTPTVYTGLLGNGATLSFAPNPSREYVIIRFEGLGDPCYSFKVINNIGKIEKEFELPNKVPKGEYILSTEGMSSGIYTLNVYCDGQYIISSSSFVVFK